MKIFFTTETQRRRENLNKIKLGLNAVLNAKEIKGQFIQFLHLTSSVPLCLCGEGFRIAHYA
jgi:hypothetical protein